MSCTPLAFSLHLVAIVLILCAIALFALVVVDRALITRHGRAFMCRYGVKSYKALLLRPFPGLRAWVRLGGMD